MCESYCLAALAGLLVALGMMGLIWLASLWRRDASLVDRFWGFGFVLLAWFWWWLGSRDLLTLLPVVLVSIWGVRLSLYLSWRNWGHGEDYRYREMRAKHGGHFWWVSLFTVFSLQAVIMWVVAFPLFALAYGGLHLEGVLWVALAAGVLLWCVGLFFEAVGDWQLTRFKADPANRGKVMDRGLWRYTRHPNYFGDICVWWAFWLMSLPAGGWWTAFGPALMTIAIIRFSGVSLLEKSLKDKKPEYADYVRRTNALIPGPRR
jgi:steroid 5-alpha reductase family enzyme